MHSRFLTPSIGSEVVLAQGALLSGAHASEIRDLLDKRGVLLFREACLSDDEQIAFAATIGDVLEMGNKAVQKITLDPVLNETADYLHATIHWHIDGAQDAVPTRASMLSMRRMSDSGGQTEFANTYAAYEALPEDEKRRIETVRVVHTQENIQRQMHPDPTEAQLARWRRHSPKTHPLVWTHRSGRKSLVLGLTASHVEGMDLPAGRMLLDHYQSWATQPRFVYRHEWTVGDFIIWDNTGCMHRVEKYPADSGRLLSRTTLVGEEPLV